MNPPNPSPSAPPVARARVAPGAVPGFEQFPPAVVVPQPAQRPQQQLLQTNFGPMYPGMRDPGMQYIPQQNQIHTAGNRDSQPSLSSNAVIPQQQAYFPQGNSNNNNHIPINNPPDSVPDSSAPTTTLSPMPTCHHRRCGANCLEAYWKRNDGVVIFFQGFINGVNSKENKVKSNPITMDQERRQFAKIPFLLPPSPDAHTPMRQTEQME